MGCAVTLYGTQPASKQQNCWPQTFQVSLTLLGSKTQRQSSVYCSLEMLRASSCSKTHSQLAAHGFLSKQVKVTH